MGKCPDKLISCLPLIPATDTVSKYHFSLSGSKREAAASVGNRVAATGKDGCLLSQEPSHSVLVEKP